MNRLYSNLQEDYKKMRLQLLTLTCVVRRLQDDESESQVKIDKLSMARIYLIDKIKDLESKLEEARLSNGSDKTDGVSNQANLGSDDEDGETKDRLKKDARIRAIRSAVEQLKDHLSWGNYSGTSSELDEALREIFELL